MATVMGVAVMLPSFVVYAKGTDDAIYLASSKKKESTSKAVQEQIKMAEEAQKAAQEAQKNAEEAEKQLQQQQQIGAKTIGDNIKNSNTNTRQTDTGKAPTSVKDPSAVSTSAVNPVVQLGKSSNVDTIITEVNDVASDTVVGWFLKKGSSSNGYVTVNMEGYNQDNTSYDVRKTLMETTLNSINNSNLSQRDRMKLYNFVSKQDAGLAGTVRLLSEDVKSDVISGYYTLRPFAGLMSTILGVIAIVLTALVSLTILIDLAYLSLPALQWAWMKDSSKDKPKFASLEAWKAYQEYQSGDSELGILSIYFRKKVFSLSMLSICILYLVSGHIYDLAGKIISSFQGFLD